MPFVSEEALHETLWVVWLVQPEGATVNPVTSDAKFIGRIDKEKDFDLLINNLVAKQLKIP